MKALAILRPPAGTDPREAVMERAGEELRALWDLYRGGFVREMYSPGGLGAILVLETQSLEDAAERLARLPVLAEAIMTLELLEMRPFGALQMLFRA